GGSGIKGYNVYRGGVFLKQVLAPATSSTDSGLLPSVTYAYAVSAVDNAGNQSNKSGNVNVKTPVCPVTTTSTSTTTSTTTTSSTTTTLDPPTTTITALPTTTPPPTAPTTGTAPPPTTTEPPTTTTTSTTTTTTLANRPPVANAGPDQVTQTLTEITFDGSASFDLDGTLASHAWSFGDGTVASGAVVRHAYPTPGTYTATLTVTDDGGLSASASAVVTAVNRPPRADGGPAQETPVGASVLL